MDESNAAGSFEMIRRRPLCERVVLRLDVLGESFLVATGGIRCGP